MPAHLGGQLKRDARIDAKAKSSRASRVDHGSRRSDGSFRIFELGAAIAILAGILGAARLAWVCDDAFISFRYADNLRHGLGLVFNAGERVEGYSNFLWTLGIALGMQLGIDPEQWTATWGIAFYAATIVVLCMLGRRTARARDGVLYLPIAGLLASVHRDWNIYATSGLETSFFTFLVTLGYALSVAPAAPAWMAGLTVAFAALARPDGIVLVPFFMAYTVFARPARVRSMLEFAAAFFALWLPYVAWKVGYYGDFFPNTYYAKSAALGWWSQGWIYGRLYFQKYWILALAILVALATGIRSTIAHAPHDGARNHEATRAPTSVPGLLPGAEVFALVLALGFTLYVLRVGGDFMYGRMLIPLTPLYLFVLECTVARLTGRRPGLQFAVTAGLVVAFVFTPYPFTGSAGPAGIVNEREFYRPEDVEIQRAEGATLRRYFTGLPVRIAIVGSQARLAYDARPAVVIEAQTGLTDRTVARQVLRGRGRVGHEKVAPVSYLLSRKVDFVIQHFGIATVDPGDSLPRVAILFDQMPGYMIHWNPPLLAELARRGASFADFPAALDARREVFDRLPADSLKRVYAQFKAFYFDCVRDSTREARFYRDQSPVAPAQPGHRPRPER